MPWRLPPIPRRMGAIRTAYRSLLGGKPKTEVKSPKPFCDYVYGDTALLGQFLLFLRGGIGVMDMKSSPVRKNLNSIQAYTILPWLPVNGLPGNPDPGWARDRGLVRNQSWSLDCGNRVDGRVNPHLRHGALKRQLFCVFGLFGRRGPDGKGGRRGHRKEHKVEVLHDFSRIVPAVRRRASRNGWIK